MFEAILKALNKYGIRYLVIGGVAVNLHGFPRMTADLDICIAMDRDNVSGLVSMLQQLHWKPRVPVRLEDFLDETIRQAWMTEKGMKVFTVYNPANESEQLDILLESAVAFDTAYQNRLEVVSADITIPLMSLRELIALKQVANRKRDRLDIDALKQIMQIMEIEKHDGSAG